MRPAAAEEACAALACSALTSLGCPPAQILTHWRQYYPGSVLQRCCLDPAPLQASLGLRCPQQSPQGGFLLVACPVASVREFGPLQSQASC